MTLPTRNQLHAAFQRHFRNAEYLEPILAGCAEVAEQEFNRVRLEDLNTAKMPERPKSSTTPATPVVIAKKRRAKTHLFAVAGYRCPECKTLEVRLDFSFCPCCGVKIEWHQQYIRHLNKAA